jgi:hypothetical protein
MSTALDISQGGTSQTTVPGIRKVLELVPGVDVQPYDPGLENLANFNTNGFIVQTSENNFAGRTLTGTANEITVTNGNGSGGNPQFSLPSSLTFTGKTVTAGTFSSMAALSVSGLANFSGLVTMLDGAVIRNGTVNTQTVVENYGYDTDQIIWRVALEANNSYTLYSYNVTTGAFVATAMNLTQAGAMVLGSTLFANGTINTNATYLINSVQVVGARNTGWVADTGTATKTSSATYTAPTISNPPTQAEVQAIANALQAATRSIKALKDALIGHGLIGT